MSMTAKTTARAVNRRSPWKKTLRTFFTRWQMYVLVLPAIIYVFIFNYLPMYGVQIALRDFRPSKGITGSTWVGLKYFKKFIEKNVNNIHDEKDFMACAKHFEAIIANLPKEK